MGSPLKKREIGIGEEETPCVHRGKKAGGKKKNSRMNHKIKTNSWGGFMTSEKMSEP